MKKKTLSKTAASKTSKNTPAKGAKASANKTSVKAQGKAPIKSKTKVKAAVPSKKAASKPTPKVNTTKAGLKKPVLKAKVDKAPSTVKSKKKLTPPPTTASSSKTIPAKKGAMKEDEKKLSGKSVSVIETKDTKQKKDLDTAAMKKNAKPLAPGKKGKTLKKEVAEDTGEDFVETDDLIGDSEIAEYEEELQAVEELDEEDLDDESIDLLGSDSPDEDDEIILTDAEGRRYCRVKDCDQISVVEGYCRYHYLLLWRRIQIRKKILADGKLEKYVEELTTRYPDKFLEMIRKDMKTEKDFLSAISELEIDESAGDGDFEEESQTFIDEVRGLGEGTSTGVEDEEF